MSNETTVRMITGVDTRLSYCHLFEPQSFNGGKSVYSVAVLIPKTAAAVVKELKACIEQAYRLNIDRLKNKGVVPKLSEIRSPLRDGDLERPGDPAYAGCWFLNAKSDTRPAIVDAQVHPILDPAEVYSGCYARVAISFYAYNTNGNRGIGCGLNGVQKIRDGEPLGSHFNAEKEFAPVTAAEEGTEDDFLS